MWPGQCDGVIRPVRLSQLWLVKGLDTSYAIASRAVFIIKSSIRITNIAGQSKLQLVSAWL